LEVFSFLVSH
jgi:hypothetical protein